MKPTKQYIADKALSLFNEKGFVNLRLQHIADAAFVSECRMGPFSFRPR
jgi:AcrR family transcriptional regulator